MVSLEEFKKALGSDAGNMSEKEMCELNELMSRLAGVLFDAWAVDMKKVEAVDPLVVPAVKL